MYDVMKTIIIKISFRDSISLNNFRIINTILSTHKKTSRTLSSILYVHNMRMVYIQAFPENFLESLLLI